MENAFFIFLRENLLFISQLVLAVTIIFPLVLDIVFSVAVTNFNIYKRLWYFLLLGGACLIFLSLYLLFDVDGKEIILLYLGIGLILSVPLFLIRVKTEKVNAVTLDGEFDEEKNKARFFRDKVEKESVKIAQENKADRGEEINFSHIESIIGKLSAYPLTLGDKKRLEELKANIYIAKSGGGAKIKERVSENLSGLLKMMSKYGV